jgi:phosphate-transporting ATPase
VLTVDRLTRPGLGPVSFRVEAGECLAVRGPSGAGKTLLLRAIADLDPNHGQVRLGVDARDAMPAPEWRRRVAYVPAEPGWWADLARDHFPDPTSVQPLLAQLGLADQLLDREVAQLSTGERLRLALARALLAKPDCLMLDEPTGALDPEATARVEAVIAERLAEGVAVIWVTHDEGQAMRLARRVLHVENGTVQERSLS